MWLALSLPPSIISALPVPYFTRSTQHAVLGNVLLLTQISPPKLVQDPYHDLDSFFRFRKKYSHAGRRKSFQQNYVTVFSLPIESLLTVPLINSLPMPQALSRQVII